MKPSELKLPLVIDLDISEVTCQEASSLSRAEYIACARPATKLIISERGKRIYPMCEQCADHNIRNRDAVLLAIQQPLNV